MRPQKVDKAKLIESLFDTVTNDKSHKNYKRTVTLAEFYHQINTGENQSELVVKYKPNETDQQKKQRIRIPNSRTPYLVNKLISQVSEVENVDNIVDNLYFEGQKENPEQLKKLKRLNERLDHFHGKDSLKRYLFETIKHFSFHDPNAFLVLEYDKFSEDPYPWPYPLEVHSKQAYNFEYKHGILQWLITRHEKQVVTELKNSDNAEDKKRTGYKWTIYAAEYSFVLEEIGILTADDGYEVREITLKDENEPRRYQYAEFNTKNKYCPAIRIGYKADATTGRETRVAFHHPAEQLFKKLINEVAEDDLAMALHGFLQKFVYAPNCDYVDNSTGSANICINGKMSIDNSKCPQCEGTGMLVHKTVQDVVIMKMPQEREEVIPLNQLVHYVSIPTDLIKLRKEEIKVHEKEVSLAIFNANVFDRSEIAMTATEKRLNLRGVYNVLGEYGENFVRIYKHFVWLAANHVKAEDGLIVQYGFPKDMKMETIEELIANRGSAVNAGSPYEVVHGFDMAILAKQHRDDPDFLKTITNREVFRPFREKDVSERMFIIAQLPEDNHFRVLYSYFVDIMTEVEEENENFYKMPDTKKKETIKSKVEEWVERYNIQSSQIAPPLGFGET